MAEETPGNLGAMFGGWASGRAAGNQRLDQSVDRLEQQINKFSDALDRLTSRLDATGRASGGAKAANGGGTTQTAGTTNGGGATFGGAAAAAAGAVGLKIKANGGYEGKHTADTTFADSVRGWRGPQPDPAHRGSPNYGGAAKVVAGVGAAAMTSYAFNHYDNQQIGATLGQQFGYAGNWSESYRSGFGNNYSASSDSDAFKTAGMLGRSSGYVMGSSGYNQQRQVVQGIALSNPNISQEQAATATLGLQTAGSFNKLTGLGYSPMNAQGKADPRSLARQVLARMGSGRVKTEDQVAAAFAPSGSATVTINSMITAGAIPPESRDVVISEMRAILRAQVGGMSYGDYTKNATTASSSSDMGERQEAQKALAKVGISARSPVARQQESEGMARDTEVETIKGFAKGLEQTTDVLQEFRQALTSILKIPGVGEGAGWLSGALPSALGAVGKVGKFLTGNAGGTAPTMSQGPAGWGGGGMDRQSSGNSHGHGGSSRGIVAAAMGGGGSAGAGLIAPRPGVNSMSSEQDYGPRNIGQGFHTGIDLEGRTGDPIKAAAGGVVVSAGWDGGYGNTLVIDHGGGWSTMYAHMSGISKGKGRKVNQNEGVGSVGDTGSYSQGSHLHFEVHKNGNDVDPEPYLRGKKMVGASGGKGGGNGPTKGSFGWDGKDRYKNLGAVKPWVDKAAEILGSKFGITTIGGYRASSAVANSDHPKGLALDFMCSKSQGDKLAAFAASNMRALNITYLIWRQRINSGSGWRGMEDRGSPTANHMDHVHISFMSSPVSDLTGGSGKSAGHRGDGTGAEMGAGQENANATAGGGGGGGVYGGYSEVAALGIGGSGGGPGTTGGSESADSGAGGSSGGGGMSRPSSGARTNLSIGSYNVLNSTSNAQTQRDLKGAMNKVGVLSLQELSNGNKRRLGAWIKDEGWGFTRPTKGETALAWDKDRYKMIKSGSRALNKAHGKGGLRKYYSPYVLLEDQQTGERFWQVGAHTAHLGDGSSASRTSAGKQVRSEQYDALRDLMKDLGKSGDPVFLAGDMNNRKPPLGMAYGQQGIDKIMYNKGDATLTGKGRASGSSDHPFVWSNFAIGDARHGGGGKVTGNGGSPAQNMALAQQILRSRGMSNQWGALKQLWMHESSWRTNADNPSSSAYGIPQMLTELHGLGDKYKTDPKTQINVGLNYIKGRYGTPQKAWDFWQKNNWYDSGEWQIRDDKDARVHKGEMILPSKVADIVRNELTAPGIGSNLGRSNGAGGVVLKFEKDSINVHLPGGSQQEARRAGTSIVDAITSDRRMRVLAEG